MTHYRYPNPCVSCVIAYMMEHKPHEPRSCRVYKPKTPKQETIKPKTLQWGWRHYSSPKIQKVKLMVMLCHKVPPPYHAMTCRAVMPCHATPRHATLCHAMPFHVTLTPALIPALYLTLPLTLTFTFTFPLSRSHSLPLSLSPSLPL